MLRTTLYRSAVLLLALVVGTGCLSTTTLASESDEDIVRPADNHPETARLIARLLAHQHFRQQSIDDALSEQVLDAYLDALDPDRYYFTQSDIEEFRVHRSDLDNMLMDGDLDLAYHIYGRLKQRATERAEFAHQVIDNGIDFDTDQTLELNRREQDWVADEDALDRLWRQRIKNDALTMLLGEDDEEQTMDLLRSRYENVAKNMQRSEAEDIFEAYMGAWARSFDPHTNYLSPRNSEEFDIQMQLSLEGIGAMLRTRRDFTEIIELVPGGPAERSGELSPGDRIIGVAEGDEEMVDVVGWRLSDVVDRIRGPKESEVRLRILPGGDSDSAPRTVTLERNEIALEEQAAQKEVKEIERDDGVQRVGVITIPAFYTDFAAAQAGEDDYRSTTRDVRRHIDALKADGIDGLIIDLRGNSGGSLQEAVDMTGLFLPGGPVVQIRRSDGDTEVMRDPDEATHYDGPLAIMVDRQSASASEIFAGAMQDYGRGIVLGERTFGKGTVQTMVDLDRFSNDPSVDTGRLKMTIAKFYRITGSSTQKRGVEPDISLPSAMDSDEIGERAADNPLPWDEIDPVDYTRIEELSRAISLLGSRHDERVKDHSAYNALLDELDQIRQAREQTEVSLNRAQREQERAQRNEARLAKANEHRQIQGLEPLDSVDELEREDDPDTLLDVSAEIMADFYLLRNEPEVAQRWGFNLND
ncbi:carboxy terminal-processing peptidase [Aquisalimonas sp. 2447]|uniref:carboxy terminal-processing peptidase n=1 Tax=Aquisalimonas sp. 2447 TaxID=2740807 RepID=UPI0014323FAB|nr:carboxy terminal-processing peptidase [Aquisalimonas sp. 2447]QIT55564.1 carboxy terminal-processing peptidase [Aquisalimonas sp. 2447]